jgi:DNA-binding CsgD family transcriptional regulator
MKNNTSEVISGLTPRELTVAKLISAGMTNKEIGRALAISSATAKLHRSRIFKKFGVRGLSGFLTTLEITTPFWTISRTSPYSARTYECSQNLSLQ